MVPRASKEFFSSTDRFDGRSRKEKGKNDDAVLREVRRLRSAEKKKEGMKEMAIEDRVNSILRADRWGIGR